MNKLELRKHYRAVRQGISPPQREFAQDKLAQLFIKSPLYENHQHFACYMAFRDELDITPIIHQLWDAKKICYLPLLVNRNDILELDFAEYKEGDPLHTNRFGILEPSSHSRKIATHALDVVLTPLIAFDRQLNRLGTGGGYYDRTFANGKNSALIGVAFARQEAPVIPADDWDVKLAGVLTENELIMRNNRT